MRVPGGPRRADRRHRATGIIIDVAALDVLDSFGSSALRDLAHMARLRGAVTVIVGIQPDVAFAIVKLGMTLDLHTALDLEEGLSLPRSPDLGQANWRIGARLTAGTRAVIRG